MKLKIESDVENKNEANKKCNSGQNMTEDEQIDLFVKILVNVYLKIEHEKDNNAGE